jgi:hypothetical protein
MKCAEQANLQTEHGHQEVGRAGTGMTANAYGVSFQCNANVPKLSVVIVHKSFNTQNVPFTKVYFMVCELS